MESRVDLSNKLFLFFKTIRNIESEVLQHFFIFGNVLEMLVLKDTKQTCRRFPVPARNANLCYCCYVFEDWCTS